MTALSPPWRKSSAWLLILPLVFQAGARATEPAPLTLIRTIPLKGPAGRLDHLALDAMHGRLFVANMANNSLDIVDLKAGKLLKQVPGQKGIQGIAYAPDLDRIFVGNGKGNACNVFDGKDVRLLRSIALEDADNVRYDQRNRRVHVGHAEKGLAAIDAQTLRVHANIALPGPPESFQLEKGRARLYLNSPSPAQVVVIDLTKNAVLKKFPLRLAGANYPLALDEAGKRLFIGRRRRPMVVVMDSETGKELAGVPIPNDVDDLFFDARRKRIYAACGEGFLVVLGQTRPDRYRVLAKVATARLARTALFDPDKGRLYGVLPRQANQEGPEVRVYLALP
jgi:DNA-binding beta-propeller fold protein YncE